MDRKIENAGERQETDNTMIIDADSPFKDKKEIVNEFEDKNDTNCNCEKEKTLLDYVQRANNAELNYRELEAKREILEAEYRNRCEFALDMWKLAKEQAIINVRTRFNEENLKTEKMKEAWKLFKSQKEMLEYYKAKDDRKELDEVIRKLYEWKAGLNNNVRRERAERLLLFSKIISNNKQALKVAELIN